jgi:dTDP-4-dehydrorhamnose reductase
MTQRIVVLGGSGFVGARVVELWRRESTEVLAPTHAELDVLDTDQLAAFLSAAQADAVINLAAWADVDGAEAEAGDRRGRVFALNANLPASLASTCHGLGQYLVHISTDYVFDGTSAERPYREEDPVGPLAWYAYTKAEGERRVMEANAAACVARIEMPFSGLDAPKRDVARIFHSRMAAGLAVIGVVDQNITPLFLDDAARALRLLVDARHSGLIHLASTTHTTPYEYAHAIARRFDLDAALIQAQTLEQFAGSRPARRPQHSWLDVSQFERRYGAGVLRSVEAELDSFIEQRLAVASRG